MRTARHFPIVWAFAAFGVLYVSWASGQHKRERVELEPVRPTLSVPVQRELGNRREGDVVQRFFLTCDKAGTIHSQGSPIEVTLDGKSIKCPDNESPPWLRAAPHLATSGVASKLYFYSNVGTQRELDLQLRKVGIPESWIKNNSSSLFRSIKSRPANRLFGVLALAEGVYAIYELFVPGEPVLQRSRETTSAPSADCEKLWGFAHRILCSEVKP